MIKLPYNYMPSIYDIKLRHANDRIYANFNGFFYIIRKHLINEQSVKFPCHMKSYEFII